MTPAQPVTRAMRLRCPSLFPRVQYTLMMKSGITLLAGQGRLQHVTVNSPFIALQKLAQNVSTSHYHGHIHI